MTKNKIKIEFKNKPGNPVSFLSKKVIRTYGTFEKILLHCIFMFFK